MSYITDNLFIIYNIYFYNNTQKKNISFLYQKEAYTKNTLFLYIKKIIILLKVNNITKNNNIK